MRDCARDWSEQGRRPFLSLAPVSQLLWTRKKRDCVQSKRWPMEMTSDMYFRGVNSNKPHDRQTVHVAVAVPQVIPRTASLNSADAFVLDVRSTVYIWCGKGCSGDEREFAKEMAKKVNPRDYQILTEGSEPQQFWNVLGGKGPYASAKLIKVGCASSEWSNWP